MAQRRRQAAGCSSPPSGGVVYRRVSVLTLSANYLARRFDRPRDGAATQAIRLTVSVSRGLTRASVAAAHRGEGAGDRTQKEVDVQVGEDGVEDLSTSPVGGGRAAVVDGVGDAEVGRDPLVKLLLRLRQV